MTRLRVPAGVAALVAISAVAPMVFGGALQGIAPFLFDPLDPGEVHAPPEVRLNLPAPHSGVGLAVDLTGYALSRDRDVSDIHFRVDGGSWRSIPDIPRGQPGVPFATRVELAPGDHVVEVRASDGEFASLPARVVVRAAAVAPPTVTIVSPSHGEGVEAGDLVVTGTVEAAGPARVWVSVANVTREATVIPRIGGPASWKVTLPVPPGLHQVTARASHAAQQSLPAVVPIAAGIPAPPTIDIATPLEGSAFGSRGDSACASSCILFAGSTTPGTREVRVEVDGLSPPVGSGVATLTPAGAWTYRLPLVGLYAGEHRVSFTAVGPAGDLSHPQEVGILLRTPHAMRLLGDDAPRPTATPLEFRLDPPVEQVTWWLDGERLVAPGPTASVILETPGAHRLVAQATDEHGRVAQTQLSLHAINRAPIATVRSDAGVAGRDVAMEARASDPDGRIVAYEWDFGDGTALATQDGEVTHRYQRTGLYRVNVSAIDDHGARSPNASLLVPVTPAPPEIDFAWEPHEPTLLDDVLFTARWRLTGPGPIAFHWEFGDGATDSGENATHRFRSHAPHVVTLHATDATGATVSAQRIVPIRNLVPEARFAHEPSQPTTGEIITFTDASVDPDGNVVGWRWSFGDCVPPGCDPESAFAVGRVATHAYAAPGRYHVALQVMDATGAIANVTLPVDVSDAAPRVERVHMEPAAPRAHDAIHFRALAHDVEDELVAFEWSFGDGATSSLREPTHRYARAGTYQAAVNVTDASGQQTRHPFFVVVVNAPPRVSLAAPEAFATLATRLEVTAVDIDGRLVEVRVDADGDGRDDCLGLALECEFVYDRVGTYVARAVAVDDAGALVSDTLAIDVRAPPAHLVPPNVTIENPAPETTLKGTFLLVGNARAAAGIDRVEIQLRDGVATYSPSREAWTLAEGARPWRFLLDTRALPDGDYDLVVRATASDGTTAFAKSSVTIANGEQTRVALRLLDEPGVLEDDRLLRGSAWHPDGVTSVRWRLDGGAWSPAEGAPLAFGIPLARDAMAPGEHVLEVAAWHGAVEHASQQVRFRIPDEPPRLVVDEPPASVQYGLLASSGRLVGPGKVVWRLDHGFWQELPPGSAWRLSEPTHNLTGGMRTLELKAVSPDGRLESEVFRYRVEVVNPAVHPARPEGAVAGQLRHETPMLPLALVGASVAVALVVARRFGALPPRL